MGAFLSGKGETSPFLGYLSAWEEARGAFSVHMLTCESTSRTSKQK